jgi:hypothetical protein
VHVEQVELQALQTLVVFVALSQNPATQAEQVAFMLLQAEHPIDYGETHEFDDVKQLVMLHDKQAIGPAPEHEVHDGSQTPQRPEELLE